MNIFERYCELRPDLPDGVELNIQIRFQSKCCLNEDLKDCQMIVARQVNLDLFLP